MRTYIYYICAFYFKAWNKIRDLLNIIYYVVYLTYIMIIISVEIRKHK